MSARRIGRGGMIAYAYARLYLGELAGVAILDVPLPGIAPWDTADLMATFAASLR